MQNLGSKLKNNFILSLCFFLVTALGQIVFYTIHESLTLQVPVSKFFALFIIIFLFSFIKQNVWRFIAMGFIFWLSFFQMIHLEYFGLPVHATEIYLLFTQSGEILGTLKEDLFIFLRPLLIIIPHGYLLWRLNQKFTPQVATRFLYFLFIFYFIYNPLRTFATGNNWGRQPSTQEFDGMNIYISFSYFLGKILPHKLSENKVYKESNFDIVLSKEPTPKRNIIVIQGESLSPNHMSLYDYKRVTTPYLESLKSDGHFVYRRGISAGVSTDISVAFFMNTTFGLSGNRTVFNTSRCFFKLAKENQFKTFFFSTQSQQQLRYITNSICPRFIDHYKNLEDISPDIEDENTADDHHLVTELSKMNLNEPGHFILLHQRGSHSPYNLRFTKDSDKFTEVDASISAQKVNHYDNSVYHFDQFMQKLIEIVKKSSIPTSIFYISDHGEGLGEEGVWGHGLLNRPSFEIPVLLYTENDPPMHEIFNAVSATPTHLNVSLMILKAMGYNSNTSLINPPENYQILGNDMDGFAGYLDLKFKDNKLESFERKDI